MSTLTLTTTAPNAQLIGELTRHTLNMIKPHELATLFSSKEVSLDLAQVDKVDTAGLAWLFSLLEQAHNRACILTYRALPDKLYKLIELSGVEGLLPIEQQASSEKF